VTGLPCKVQPVSLYVLSITQAVAQLLRVDEHVGIKKRKGWGGKLKKLILKGNLKEDKCLSFLMTRNTF
jgi:hypothetical protein